LAGDAGKFRGGVLDVRQAVSVGGDHDDGFRLQHHQRAVQRVTRFFIGDGEDGFRDQGAQDARGKLDYAGGRENGQLRIVRARHANHLGVGASAADLHPVVLHGLDGDIAFGQQLHIVIQFARRNGAGDFFLHLGCARRTKAEIEVGCGDGKFVAGSFEEEIGKYGDGGLALDHALRGGELTQKIGFADGDFHARRRRFYSGARHATYSWFRCLGGHLCKTLALPGWWRDYVFNLYQNNISIYSSNS